MRKKYLFGMLLSGLLCLSSCSDSDDDSVAQNTLSMYGNTYILESGMIWQSNPNSVVTSVPYIYEDNYEMDGQQFSDKVEGTRAGDESVETGNFTISLYEHGLTVSPALEKAQGKGATICLQLCSPELNQLKAGEYTFADTKQPFTFIGFCASDYNTQDRNPVPAQITEGKLSVERSGDNYSIRFSGKTSFEGEVSASYNGPLQTTRVSQVSSTEYENVRLAGLLDMVAIKYWYPLDIVQGWMNAYGYTSIQDVCMDFLGDYMGVEDDKVYFGVEYDYDDSYEGTALFSLSTGIAQVAYNMRRATTRPLVDLALVWDKDSESFYFESPIKVRSILGHSQNYNYDFPTHTIYMAAPAGFTDADFENISADDFLIDVTDQKVMIPAQNFKPAYIFFKTGKGVTGVIRVKEYIPQGTVSVEDWGTYMDLVTNPTLVIDIKCPAVVANPQIR